jgi:hypothetical protein
MISYYDSSGHVLMFVHCNDVNCTGNDEVPHTLAATAGITDQYDDMALDADGFPVVSFVSAGGDLALVHCTDADCLGKVVTTLDATVTAATYTSIVLDASDFPVVSYVDSAASSDRMKVVRCTDADCLTKEISTVDNAGVSTEASLFTSLVLDASGNPIIASDDSLGVNDTLIVTHCVDPFCNPKRIRTVNP